MKMKIRQVASDNIALWLIALPGIAHLFIFKYMPMAGNVMAFQNYSIFLGVFKSPWVGFEHFAYMFQFREFYQILRNTVVFALYSIVLGFPAPLILALFVNEVRLMVVKRPVQTLLYLPHFLSWVIVGGVFINVFSVRGIVNRILSVFGVEPIYFLAASEYFIQLVVSIGIWKEVGWGMILYLAALAGINPHLYEAAVVDGAGRWRSMVHITLPSLMPTIVVLFLLRVGQFLDSNVEQVLVFLNPLVQNVGEVVDTYVYRVGLLGGQFSYTTGIGLFKSAIGLVLVIGLNQLSKKLTGESIY